MKLETLAWLSVAAYAIHILEEFSLDWRSWARNVIGLPVDWDSFYVTNAAVVVLGIAQAMTAPELPLCALTYASLMIVNAVVFHVAPMVRTRGRYSPGAATGVTLFLPIGAAVWWRAAADGDLTIAIGALAVVGGAALMAYPVVLLRLRERPYFRQDRT